MGSSCEDKEPGNGNSVQSSAKDCASCNISTVQRDRPTFNARTLPAIIHILMSLVSTQAAFFENAADTYALF